MANHIKPQILEKDLLVKLTSILKLNGYNKKNKTWRKILNEYFALNFCIETSKYDKLDYSVVVGVSLLGLTESNLVHYGNFLTEITVINAEQVYSDSVKFFNEWTDKKIIKKKIQALKDWRDRNPPLAISGTMVKENSPYPIPSQELLVYKFVLSSDFFAD